MFEELEARAWESLLTLDSSSPEWTEMFSKHMFLFHLCEGDSTPFCKLSSNFDVPLRSNERLVQAVVGKDYQDVIFIKMSDAQIMNFALFKDVLVKETCAARVDFDASMAWRYWSSVRGYFLQKKLQS